MIPIQTRYGHTNIESRPSYSWPNNKKLAFYICTNLEVFAFLKGDGALDSATINAKQTHRNYAWRDYGLRIGIWRLFKMFEEFNIPVAHNVNSLIYKYRPDIIEKIKLRNDEVVAHGRTNSEHQDDMWEPDEKLMIKEVTQTIENSQGLPPLGWLGPGLAETSVTLDLLQEQGYKYVMDWPCDDQPFWMKTRNGKILSIPYSIEINDGPALARRQHSAREFADMIVDQFDEMIEQCLEQPLVFSIILHPFITGQPFRLKPLRQAISYCLNHPHADRLWITKPGEIADYCYKLPDNVITNG